MPEDLDKLRKEGYTHLVILKNPDFKPAHINFNKGLEELSINKEEVFCSVENFKIVKTKNQPEISHFPSKYIICIKNREVEPCLEPTQ